MPPMDEPPIASRPGRPAYPIGEPRERSASAKFWMRGVAFATLHRALWSAARKAQPVRAHDINDAVRSDWQRERGREPSATTLYRYRTTLERLDAMRRGRRVWAVNRDDENVRMLVQTAPQNTRKVSGRVREAFGNLVLSNRDCGTLLFDMFATTGESSATLAAFSGQSSCIVWRHQRSSDCQKRLDLWNESTGARRTYTEDQAIRAVLYGLRYWARTSSK